MGISDFKRFSNDYYQHVRNIQSKENDIDIFMLGPQKKEAFKYLWDNISDDDGFGRRSEYKRRLTKVSLRDYYPSEYYINQRNIENGRVQIVEFDKDKVFST